MNDSFLYVINLSTGLQKSVSSSNKNGSVTVDITLNDGDEIRITTQYFYYYKSLIKMNFYNNKNGIILTCLLFFIWFIIF